MDSADSNSAALLNEHQARRLRVTCQYADKMIGEIEEILNSASSKAAFPRFVQDISQAQRRTIEDYLARIRAQLVRVLDGQQIPRPEATIPASRAVYVELTSIDIAVEELRPSYMRGYGEVSPALSLELEGIAGELRGLLSRLAQYLLHGIGEDLRQRLLRLEQTTAEIELLSKLERIIADRGLVEFRPSLATIVDRLEDRTLEIAVFGRVSSGKSSLLNAILGSPVLPVGVTPITAVPTRIRYGEKPRLTVCFAERPEQRLNVSRLIEFASEQQNPGNEKRVTRLIVDLPSPRLREGTTFVDTPGLGSLAATGAAETLAYLPKCDLGVFLIDLASTLTQEDLQTVQTLQQAAIPVHVLLSKSDLLSQEDLERMTVYVRRNISSELRVDLPVHAVSALPGHLQLLNRWFDAEISPMYERSQELKSLSLKRKIGALRESVIGALTMRVRRDRGITGTGPDSLREIEARLRRATGQIKNTNTNLEREIQAFGQETQWILACAADRLQEMLSGGREQSKANADLLISESIVQFVHQRVKVFRQQLESLARELQADLAWAAQALGYSHLPTEEEFLSVMRAMPVFDFASQELRFSLAKWPSIFGKAAVRAWMRTELRSRLESPLSKTLLIYCGVFQEWSSMVLQQLDKRFASYADAYRAQAERAQTSASVGTEEGNAILNDLQSLGAGAPEVEPKISAISGR